MCTGDIFAIVTAIVIAMDSGRRGKVCFYFTLRVIYFVTEQIEQQQHFDRGDEWCIDKWWRTHIICVRRTDKLGNNDEPDGQSVALSFL